MEELNTEVVEAEVAPIVIMDLGALAEFATKPVYTSANSGKKLYEHTVEEARVLVKVRDQNKTKKDGVVALGLNLGRNLLPLDIIKAKATRLVVSDASAEAITASLLAHVEAGAFDKEIAISLEQTKATAEKMALAANAKNAVDESVVIEEGAVEGLDLEELTVEEDNAGIEQL